MIKEPVFETGNYVERADGAIYIKFDDTRIYFNANKIVAVVMPSHARAVPARDGNVGPGPAVEAARRVVKHP